MRRDATPVRPGTFSVAVNVGAPDDGRRALASVHVDVAGAREPVRLHFYLDGDLAAVQCGTGLVYDLAVGRVAPGRHTLAVWAADGLGRRADTSMHVDLPLVDPTLATPAAASAPAARRGATWSVRGLATRIWR